MSHSPSRREQPLDWLYIPYILYIHPMSHIHIPYPNMCSDPHMEHGARKPMYDHSSRHTCTLYHLYICVYGVLPIGLRVG